MAVNPMQRKAHNSFLLGVLITIFISAIIIVILFMQIKKLNDEKKELLKSRTKVYAMSTDVKSGDLITEDMFKQIEISASAVPEFPIESSSELSAYVLCDKDQNPIKREIVNAETGEYKYYLYHNVAAKKMGENLYSVARYVKNPETGTKVTEEQVLTYDQDKDLYYYEIINGSVRYQKYYNIISDDTAEAAEEIMKEEMTEKYYYEIILDASTIEKVYVEFQEQPALAKIDLKANTILTEGMIARGQLVSNDVRRQEYNIIVLPTQLQSAEYVDVRLRLPSGQDYIVLSHKQVEIPVVGAADSKDCIWMNLSEDEILTMSSAIVEAYRMNGAKLYATRYIEPGRQEAAQITYTPSNDILKLIITDPNIVEVAKQKIANNYKNTLTTVRNPIEAAQNNEEAEDNLIEGVKNEIAGLQAERESYLESLGEKNLLNGG